MKSEKQLYKGADISVLFLAIIFFIVLCIVAYIALDYRNKFKGHAERTGHESGYIEMVTLEYFDKYISLLHTLSELPCIEAKDGKTCDDVLKRLNSRFPVVVNFAVLDREAIFSHPACPLTAPIPPPSENRRFSKNCKKAPTVIS
jgi:hypothetical protein